MDLIEGGKDSVSPGCLVQASAPAPAGPARVDEASHHRLSGVVG